jgi:hypothetical protein
MDLNTLLREEMARPAVVSDRPYAERISRATRTFRQRRAAKRTAAGFLTVIAVTAVVSVSTLVRHGAPPAGPETPDRATAAALQVAAMTNVGIPIGGQFYDPAHGWLILMTCTADMSTCQNTYLVADGSGANLRVLTTPFRIATGGLFVFSSHDMVAVDEATGVRLVSSDGGRSWTEAKQPTGPAVSQVPPDAMLAQLPETQGSKSSIGALQENGQIHPVTTLPPGASGLAAGAVAGYGGAFFVTDGTRILRRTTGDPWQPVAMPAAAVPNFRILGATGAGLYATGGPEADPILLVSRDTGRTWQELDWPSPGAFAVPRDASQTPDTVPAYDGRSATVVDGSLLVSNGVRWWRYDDVRNLFTPTDGPPAIIGQDVAGAAIAITGVTKHPQIEISTDGKTWSVLRTSK